MIPRWLVLLHGRWLLWRRPKPPRMNRGQLETLAQQLGVVAAQGLTDRQMRQMLASAMRRAPVLPTIVLQGILGQLPGVAEVDVMQLPGYALGLLVTPRWWAYLWPGRRARLHSEVATTTRQLVAAGVRVEITIL